MSYQASGTILRISDPQTYGKFTKQEFAVELIGRGEYTDQVPFETSGKSLGILDGFQEGDVVEVNFFVSGRYHEGTDRYYCNLKAVQIERLESGEIVDTEADTVDDKDNVPF